jgi:GNAT superfamily N-acetyltransferase
VFAGAPVLQQAQSSGERARVIGCLPRDPGRMQVVTHTDPDAFARVARPLLDADPVRHTMVLTVLDGVCRGAYRPTAMLTAHDGGRAAAALLRTAPYPALVSGVPARCAGPVADALAELDPDASGAQGPLPEAEAFAAAFTARTGATAEVAMRMRLFALDGPVSPPDVPGRPRAVAAPDDPAVDVLADWREAFEVELGHRRDGPPPRAVVLDAIGSGGGELLWEVDGVPVAQAAARAVTAGMSRIGPVYTPPEHRCRGYAAAVTAAAAQWALDRGARHVLLYTDLADPTTNRLYPRLGFRPHHDACELRFT